MPTPFRLSRFLPYRLAVISERASRRLAEDYGRSHGLSVAEWRVLVHLQRSGPVSIREIQTFTNLEKSRASRAVDRLVTAGMVQKHASQSDARLVEIALTSAGEQALAEILPAATAVEDRLTQDLAPEDMETFFRVLEHFHSVLDEDPAARPRMKDDLQGIDVKYNLSKSRNTE